MLTVGLAAGEKQRQPFAGHELIGFNAQLAQVITAKGAPKTQEQQGLIATSAQAHGRVRRRCLDL
ncbi:hypothetical protein D3C86_1683830 [compost metagenome]